MEVESIITDCSPQFPPLLKGKGQGARLLLLLLLFFFSFSVSPQKFEGKRELRAVWIATVNNIDWPSKPGLTTEEQKAELIAYLDLFKKLKFNAVVMQIRPCADAFYPSTLEPWSYFLTGKQGVAPLPAYDPLQFAIEECHKRCLEFHAWLNPYRATKDNDYSAMSQNHIFKQHPEWFVAYGGKTYFDPAYPETRAFVCRVVKDIVTRYDVDAIHFDDYFYPNNDFNDSVSFAKCNRGYTAENKMGWRRENVDMIIKMLHDTIKSVKPYVKFGISPYAVWRNKREDARGSDTKSYSYTNYDHLHADIRLWLEKGWIDYVLPQLYFAIGYDRLDFQVVADWWSANSFGHGLYAGIGTYRLNKEAKESAWRSPVEIVRQAKYIRQDKKFEGFCYFNAKNFKNNVLGVNGVIERQVNPYSALVPLIPGLPQSTPSVPVKLSFDATTNTLQWEISNSENSSSKPVYFVVYRIEKGQVPDFEKASAIAGIVSEPKLSLGTPDGQFDYYVTALNRLYNESAPSKPITVLH
jgi:uncharacterized lipoprotein YddW (UPF0748 family)